MRRTTIINKKKKNLKKRPTGETHRCPSRASRGRSKISTGWAVCPQRKTRANHGRALERIVRGTRRCVVLIFHPGKRMMTLPKKRTQTVPGKEGDVQRRNDHHDKSKDNKKTVKYAFENLHYVSKNITRPTKI